MEKIAFREEISFIYQRNTSVQNEDEVSNFAFLCHQNIMVFNEECFRHPQSSGTVNQPARAACCCICVHAVLLLSVIAPSCCLSLPFLVFLLLSNSEWLPMQLPLCCALFFPMAHTQSRHRGEVLFLTTGCCPLWDLKQDTGVVQGFSCPPHCCIQCVSKGCSKWHLYVTLKLTSVQLGTAAQSCPKTDGGTVSSCGSWVKLHPSAFFCHTLWKRSSHQPWLYPAYTHLTVHTSLSLSVAPKFDSVAALAAGSLCLGGILLPKHTFNERTSCSPSGPSFHFPL